MPITLAEITKKSERNWLAAIYTWLIKCCQSWLQQVLINVNEQVSANLLFQNKWSTLIIEKRGDIIGQCLPANRNHPKYLSSSLSVFFSSRPWPCSIQSHQLRKWYCQFLSAIFAYPVFKVILHPKKPFKMPTPKDFLWANFCFFASLRLAWSLMPVFLHQTQLSCSWVSGLQKFMLMLRDRSYCAKRFRENPKGLYFLLIS